MKAVVYVGLAGTLIIGVYPQPVIDWVVAATMMFSDLAGPAAALPTVPPVISPGG
jgi:NADH-quinone oxidoreductase subunit N